MLTFDESNKSTGSTDPRDWVEDFEHDNGMYMCRCCHCKNTFIGHKRRPSCKVCDVEQKTRWENLTPEQQAIESREAHRLIEEFFQNIKKKS